MGRLHEEPSCREPRDLSLARTLHELWFLASVPAADRSFGSRLRPSRQRNAVFTSELRKSVRACDVTIPIETPKAPAAYLADCGRGESAEKSACPSTDQVT